MASIQTDVDDETWDRIIAYAERNGHKRRWLYKKILEDGINKLEEEERNANSGEQPLGA
jgi:hypothetical protein